MSKRTTSSMVNSSARRLCKDEMFDNFDKVLFPTSRIMRGSETNRVNAATTPHVLHHNRMFRLLRWRQKHVELLFHRKCLMRARTWVRCGLVAQCHKDVVWRVTELHTCTMQWASVASGLSQSVPAACSIPMSVDPIMSSTMCGF